MKNSTLFFILLMGVGITHAQTRTWKHLGPFKQTIPMTKGDSPHGIGKVHTVAVKSKRKIYVGSNTAGIFMTKNKGKTWKNILDYKYSLGVMDIEIHPKKKRTLFIASGSNPFNDKNYGLGVLKSTNGGKTWDTTGLSFTPNEFSQVIVRQVLVHPTKKNRVYACTDDKVYRSNDLGDSWEVILELPKANFRDLEVDPFNADKFNVLGTKWHFTLDDGKNWTEATSALKQIKGNYKAYSRIEMTYSKEQEGLVAVCFKGPKNGIGLSIDGGKTFSKINTNVSNARIDEHTMSLEFMNDSKELMLGGVRIGKITNLVTGEWKYTGTRNPKSKDFIHDDIRELQNYKGTLYAANDGSIAYWDDRHNSWEHITGSGLTITQFYGISNNTLDPYFILGGTQDMASQMLKNGEWYNQTSLYGDGGTALHHPTNFNEIWSVRSSLLFYSNDTGKSWRWDSPRGGKGPYDPVLKLKDSFLYFASNNVFRKNLNTNKWDNMTRSLGFNRLLGAYDIYKGNQDIQIVSEVEPLYNNQNYKGKLFMTRDGGKTWKDLTANLKVLAWMQITDLLFHPTDSNQIWASIGQFHGAKNKDKLYYTKDGGLTWENQSGNLPSYPTTCLFYKDNLLFVGTDIGLFYKKIGEKNFKKYGSELPNVYISQIVYNSTVNKLRVATFGRGVWEVDFIND